VKASRDRPDLRESGERSIGPETGPQQTERGARERSRFISYVAVDSGEDGRDPDGLVHARRIELEEEAISMVLAREPNLRRTPTNNEGFDLAELDPTGQAVRWVEVKAMATDLDARPVGLSKAQWESAREHDGAYWIYVVEHAGTPEQANIVRIRDPMGKAQTFTIDRGWRGAAE
jgi:hypothetical protein